MSARESISDLQARMAKSIIGQETVVERLIMDAPQCTSSVLPCLNSRNGS